MLGLARAAESEPSGLESSCAKSTVPMAKTAADSVIPRPIMAKPVLVLKPRITVGLLLRVARAPAVFSNLTLGFDGLVGEGGRSIASGSSSGSGSSWMSPSTWSSKFSSRVVASVAAAEDELALRSSRGSETGAGTDGA